MSSRLRFSSVSSAPSGRIEGVFLDLQGPGSPSASYFLSQDLDAASLTLSARRKSPSLASGLFLCWRIRNSFSKGLSLL